MSCQVEENLTAYLDHELGAAERAHVEAHLPGCADCQATLALLQRSVDALGQLPEFSPAPSTRREVLRRLDELPRPWRERLAQALTPKLWIPAVGAAATLALVAVLTHAASTHHATPVLGGAPGPEQVTLAMNLDVASHYEMLQVDGPDDLDVVAHLDELEATP